MTLAELFDRFVLGDGQIIVEPDEHFEIMDFVVRNSNGMIFYSPRGYPYLFGRDLVCSVFD